MCVPSVLSSTCYCQAGLCATYIYVHFYKNHFALNYLSNSLTSIPTLIYCHAARFSSLYSLLLCHFLTFLSFLTPFTPLRLMSFPSAAIRHSYSFHPPFPVSSHPLHSVSSLPPMTQTATPPMCVKLSTVSVCCRATLKVLHTHSSTDDFIGYIVIFESAGFIL